MPLWRSPVAYLAGLTPLLPAPTHMWMRDDDAHWVCLWQQAPGVLQHARHVRLQQHRLSIDQLLHLDPRQVCPGGGGQGAREEEPCQRGLRFVQVPTWFFAGMPCTLHAVDAHMVTCTLKCTDRRPLPDRFRLPTHRMCSRRALKAGAS